MHATANAIARRLIQRAGPRLIGGGVALAIAVPVSVWLVWIQLVVRDGLLGLYFFRNGAELIGPIAAGLAGLVHGPRAAEGRPDAALLMALSTYGAGVLIFSAALGFGSSPNWSITGAVALTGFFGVFGLLLAFPLLFAVFPSAWVWNSIVSRIGRFGGMSERQQAAIPPWHIGARNA